MEKPHCLSKAAEGEEGAKEGKIIEFNLPWFRVSPTQHQPAEREAKAGQNPLKSGVQTLRSILSPSLCKKWSVSFIIVINNLAQDLKHSYCTFPHSPLPSLKTHPPFNPEIRCFLT